MVCTPQQQYDFLKACANHKSENLEDVIIQYKHEILNIHGFFLAINDLSNLQPVFATVGAQEVGLGHDVHILDFFQNNVSAEEKQEFANDSGKIFLEKNLDQLCDFIVKKVGDTIDLKIMYFRIRFDLDNIHPNSNTVCISLADYMRIRDTINSIVELVENGHSAPNLWKNIPVASIRSKLYSYAQDHPEIEQIWLAIYSNVIFSFYQADQSKKLTEQEQDIIEFIHPILNENVSFIISPLQDMSDFFDLEQQIHFKKVALLYDKNKWHFWLFKWFRIVKATPILEF